MHSTSAAKIEDYNNIKDFNYVNYFSMVKQTVTLSKDQFDRDKAFDDLKKGFSKIECSNCDCNALYVNISSKETFCYRHYKNCDNPEIKVSLINNVLKEFTNCLINLEKHLAMIQVITHFHKTYNQDVKVNKKDERNLIKQNEILSRRIEEILLNIEELKDNKSIDNFFKAQRAYDDSMETINELFKQLFGLLMKPMFIIFMKALYEELGLNYNDEDNNSNNTEIPLPCEVYENSFSLINFNFLAFERVKNFESQVHGLYKFAKCNNDQLNEYKVKAEKLQKELNACNIKLEWLVEESKIDCKDIIIEDIEIGVINDENYKELKSKIEEIMEITKSEKLVSTTLDQVLSNSETFDKEKHYKLISLFEERLIELGLPGDSKFCTTKTSVVMREVMVDFLLKLKDKHPFSNLKDRKVMDVNDIIMDFIFQNGFEPSAKLKLHYSQSEVTKKLNEFPSYDILNEAFKGEMDEESYEILKKRIINSPSITFFLNPDPSIPITTKIHGDKFMVGYFKSGTVKRIGAGMEICKNGYMYQGYFKDDKWHNYGREILNKYSYEGGYDMSNKRGKGTYLNFRDETKEIGLFTEKGKQGLFECYDREGHMKHKTYINNKEVLK